jgi:lantibiotic modifying enzyme
LKVVARRLAAGVVLCDLSGMSVEVAEVEAFAGRAVDWLVAAGRGTSTGTVWPDVAGGVEPDFMLYSGGPGVVVALLEAHRHFGDERLAAAATKGALAVAAAIESTRDSSLYFGLMGMAFALRATGEALGTREFDSAVETAVQLVRSRCQDRRWGDFYELLGGNAGIALGALALGEPELALLAVEHYRHTAEPTAGGVTWQTGAMFESRLHHISHGTLGIALALAATGSATAEPALNDLALAGLSPLAWCNSDR